MPAPAFRIFVSSTFADLGREREALRSTVFPRLRALSRRHGAQFLAVDLRWGVSPEAAVDQRTVAICLEEVDRCLQTGSPMVVLLGDRYGWRPLPDPLPAGAFEALRERIPSPASEELARWYRRDENAEPPEYRLQPRGPRRIDDDEWSAVEARLRDAFVSGAGAAGLSPCERRRIGASATELEILRGALQREDVFCYFREIQDLPLDGSAGVFGEADAGAREALERLKRDLSDAAHVRRYRARWSGEAPTLDHLPQLCDDAFADLSAAILRRLQAARPSEPEEHAAFGRARSRLFVGRAEALDRIRTYLADDESRTVLAIVGPSGSGKSTLAGRLREEIAPPMLRVVRFVGATAASTMGTGLLGGVCQEIARAYGEDESTIPSAYRELADELKRFLAMATAERPLVVAIDALDQLGDDDPARDLAWLPAALPANVRMIVSATDAFRDALAAFDVLELAPMPESDGAELLGRWLAQTRRTLKDEQREAVLEAFRRTGLPLHLRLLAEEARRWTSYDPAPAMAPDVAGVIEALFARLSGAAEHGEVLVRRSLGYLAATKHGLSEDEMVSVLSDDPEVMTSFRARSPRSPPVDALPTIVWSRLYSDVAPYLVERSADGTALLGFFHRQLREVAEERYLADDDRVERHRALARFFADQALDPEGAANLRKLSEQPYQQTLGELWDDAFETLTDFVFLEHKATHAAVEERTDPNGNVTHVHGGVYLLEEDYRRALRLWP